MSFAILKGGVPTEFVPSNGGILVGGVTHPANILSLWSEADLAAIGVRRIAETPIPEGKVSAGSSLQIIDGIVTRVHTLVDAPPPPVPEAITPLQARKALRQTGLKAAVDNYVSMLPEEQQEEWEYAIEVRRDNATLNNGWALLGKSQAELDDLFRLGATL